MSELITAPDAAVAPAVISTQGRVVTQAQAPDGSFPAAPIVQEANPAPASTEAGTAQRRGQTAPVPTATAGGKAEEARIAVESNSYNFLFGERTVQFSFDRTINRVVIRVKDAETGETLRQIPPDDFLKFSANFRELLGVLFDGKA